LSKKIYFASDFHLGIDAKHTSREREMFICKWLSEIQDSAEAIYLLGDIFDFWFEYGKVIPKGFNRFLGKLAEIKDMNIPVFIFTGNHDMWMFDYFEKELNIPVFRDPITVELKSKVFHLGHGDGLGPGDYSYKLIKGIFRNRICQTLFSLVPPGIGMRLAHYWSRKSRLNQSEPEFLGADREWIIQYAEEHLKNHKIDYYIFGHRHLPIRYELSNGTSSYFNLGDWMQHYSYAEFDGEDVMLREFPV
jgi:UDP-2,3-diacylglucosamine hydrolase